MSRATGGARPWNESAGRVGQRHLPRPPTSALIDAPRQSNFRLRASFFVAIITTATTPDSHPDCRALLIQIVALHPRSDPRTASINTFGPAVSGKRISLGGWAVRGFAGILLAAGIGVAAIIWLGSPGDAAKTSQPQPAALAQTASTAAAPPPELTLLLESMARDL